MATTNKTGRVAVLAVLGVVLAAMSIGTPAQAVVCIPGLSEGSTECGLNAVACGPVLFDEGPEGTPAALRAQHAEACNLLDEVDCPPNTYWIVNSGFASAGPRDYVIGSMVCSGETIAVCVADLLENPCSTTGDSVQGRGECVLDVFDNFDGITVQDPYVSCQDPVDPERVIPALIRYQR